MEVYFLRFLNPSAHVHVHLHLVPSLFYDSKKRRRRNCKLNAIFKNEEDAATERASLRFQETLRPDPLFIDPYVGCLVPPDFQVNMKQHPHKHCLATKFIDDKLLTTMNHTDGLRQVVLLTDGMDTRPYRLNWPASTIIFDVSPERIFRKSTHKLKDIGAKIPRSCLFYHIPSETSDIQQILRSKGFNGARPSLWAFQGQPILTLANFKEILEVVSSLAMKECLFLGELPAWLAETEGGVESTTRRWMNKLFMSHGFDVDIIAYDEVAGNLGTGSTVDDYKNMLFVAEHLRFSDDQMEIWRTEFQRIEEEGDEEGFEEL
ncbi:S-adenosyl-L-methionine-dependent methyltransferase superfamily protein [Forsythia ovata]|uniref:S-adenosyl-L-methionine-dependent methyltransferase superfamily protein n=1 Tax=Forsythia ovata TaxID=205694 RepID=A0ABD1X3X8_9LAMI